MAPTRILHVVTKMEVAGLENRLMDLYRQIDRNEYQFDFFTCSTDKGFYDEEILKLGGRVYYSTPITLTSLRTVKKELKNVLLTNPEYNYIHCHLNQWCGFILKIAKNSGVPIRIAHSRTSLDVINLKNALKNIIKRNTNKYATHKMAVSLKAASWLFGNKAVQRNEVTILPNAIDFKKFVFNENIRDKYRQENNISNSLVLVHVGNIKPEKNHEYLLKVFHKLKKVEANSKLIIIGRDHLNGRLQEIAEELNIINDVMFLGSRTDISNWLSASDIFVFPSLYEGFPGSVLEAQANGLPCLISKNITKEVKLSDRLVQLDLEKDKSNWVNEILRLSEKYKNIRKIDFKDNRYTIENSARELIEFYKNIEIN